MSGRASTKITCLGDCTGTLRSFTDCWISAVIASWSGSLPARSTTTAVTASPHLSSGVPTTPTWATEGCSATTSSTSREDVAEAAGDDHVLGAVDDVPETVGILAGDIAGAQPAVDEGFGGLLGRPQ